MFKVLYETLRLRLSLCFCDEKMRLSSLAPGGSCLEPVLRAFQQDDFLTEVQQHVGRKCSILSCFFIHFISHIHHYASEDDRAEQFQ